MIRSLRPDELPWFVGRSLHYLGHSDPKGLSLRLSPLLSNAASDSRHCYVLARAGAAPSAGIFFTPPDPDDDSGTAVFASPWHHDDNAALAELVAELLQRHTYEAALLELHSLDAERRRDLLDTLAPLGFQEDELIELRFELSEAPPLGAPLVFEAWTAEADRQFRTFYGAAEQRPASDAGWAFLKRRHGRFHPDLWLVARETLDQDPVGYAFCGSSERRLDARYNLDAVGVRHDLRADSDMLRRLVISLLNELAALSPVGSLSAELSASDPKLIGILRSIGFDLRSRTPVLVKPPG